MRARVSVRKEIMRQEIRIRRLQSGSAFSLIELIMVLAIVSLLALLAMPRYQRALAHYRASSAARRIVADFGLARSAARSSGAGQTVKFNVSASSYQLVGYKSMDWSMATYSVNLADEPYRTALIAVSFNGADQVVFDRYGTPSAGGTVTVQSGEFRANIALDGQSGKAVIQ